MPKISELIELTQISDDDVLVINALVDGVNTTLKIKKSVLVNGLAKQTDLNSTNSKVTTLEGDLSTTNGKVATLEQGLESANGQISSLKTEVDNTKSALETTNTNLGLAEDRITVLENKAGDFSDVRISDSYYGEVATWQDGNPSSEDRLYRFVTIVGNNREIGIANSTSQIVGTSNLIDNVGFLGNYIEGVESDTSKAIVSILGCSYVKTNDNTIVANDRVMSDDNGYAVKSSNNLGYRVLKVVERGLLEIVVSPNTDLIQRVKAHDDEQDENFKNYYNKTEVNNLLDNIDITGMVKQEEGGTVEEVVTPTNADTLGGKLTANNVVFYEEEIVNEVGQVVLRNADLLENHPASYFATSEDLNNAIANSGLKMDLLWANASPSSEFVPQTISLDLSNYKFVYINFLRLAPLEPVYNTSKLSKINLNNEDNYDMTLMYYGTEHGYIFRHFKTTNNGIDFAQGTIGTPLPSNINNNAMVPYQIYGVK